MDSVDERIAVSNDFLRQWVIGHAEDYMHDMEGMQDFALYDMVVEAVEKPLLQWAMQRCGNNQRAAARILGINRNTLHKKLVIHGLLKESF